MVRNSIKGVATKQEIQQNSVSKYRFTPGELAKRGADGNNSDLR